MIEKIKREMNSLYWRQFMLTAGMVLLTIFLLGVSFFALSYSTNAAEKRRELRSRAELIAKVSVDYVNVGNGVTEDQDAALQNLAEVASRMSEVDFLICANDGTALLTTEEELGGHSIRLPDEIMSAILSPEGVYEGRSTVGGIYETKRYVVGVPIYGDGGALLGVVLSVMDMTELMSVWQSSLGLFLMTSATILLLAVVFSSLTATRQIRPITDMVRATRAYADGNFDVRLPEMDSSSEINELAQSFNAMADSLTETERQRRDFIANVSHELKTPMTTIAGYTDGILDGTIPPERERHYLQIISDESRRLSRLVRRMLDVSQIQSQEMKKEDFDICESMRLALLSMEQKINERSLDVKAAIPEDSVMVQGDRDLITQVIFNLLENAAKFATPHSTLYLGMTTNDEKAVISVRNHGATIPPEEIPLLFERFHKSDKSRSEDKDGYGLGLYVVKTILRQHKERISVTSQDNITSFDFTMQLSHPLHNN